MSLAQARESDDRRGNVIGGNLEVELKNNQPKAINVPSKLTYLAKAINVPSKLTYLAKAINVPSKLTYLAKAINVPSKLTYNI
jgi:hypothetical protein